MSLWRISMLVTAMALTLASQAGANPPSLAISNTAKHIEGGRFGEAIRTAEAAADRDVVHPDLSFNRGLSYLRRAQSSTADPGDLGQAAAGFAETLVLRPSDAEAERGLEQVQLLLAQDRTMSNTSPEGTSLGLVESVLWGIAPWLLLGLGGLGSLLACVGLILRRSRKESSSATGGIVALLGVFLLLPSLLFASARSYLFADSRVAVVIADSAEVVDEGGGRLAGQLPYRQGTVVRIWPVERGLAPLVNFEREGRIPVARLRMLSPGSQ